VQQEANPLILTGGDPAGISPEIIEKVAHVLSGQHVIYFATSGKRHQEQFLRNLKNSTHVHIIDVLEKLNLSEAKSGIPSYESGLLSLTALKLACEFIANHKVCGLCTAPLSKEAVSLVVPDFHGHTDYLADFFQSDVIMLMHGLRFSVIPLTVHIPLQSVSEKLKIALYKPSLISLLKKLQTYSSYQGPVAIASLNPHAGENGLLGSEENDFIIDAAGKMQQAGIPIEGPFPADGLFQEDIRSRYRLILTCYHDQGLIPFKAIEGKNGVNVTIGLPFLRTSPDHGTAFNIAGRGIADSTSMKRSLQVLLNGEFS